MEPFLYNPALLGSFIHNARVASALSIRRLAKETGVSPSQILRIESGEFDARLSTLARLAPALGVPIGLLIESSFLFDSLAFARVLGETSLSPILGSLPVERRKSKATLQRLVSCCSFEATVCLHLLRSSNPARLGRCFKYPSDDVKNAFATFAANMEEFGAADRIAEERELKSDPLESLIRLKLITPEICLHLATAKGDTSQSSEPDRYGILGLESPFPHY